MATLVHTGTQSAVTAASSITTNSPSASAGNTLVLEISWAAAGGSASFTPSTPTGWTKAYGPGSAWGGGSNGSVGYAVFYKTAVGGVESPVFNNPSGGSDLYANGIITEWSGMGSHDTADSSATSTNNSAASTTGVTVPNTGTLSSANSTVFTGVAILSGTGLANAGIAFSGGSWTTDVSDQNTTSSVGTIMGHKTVSANTALGAVYTWTTDSTMLAFQGAVVVFSDAAAAASLGQISQSGPGISPDKRKMFTPSLRSNVIQGVDVTVALTGVSATFSAGILTPSGGDTKVGQIPPTGPGISPDFRKLFQPSLRGFSQTDVTVALTGASATFSAGTLTPSASVSLTGQAATFAAGTLTPNTSVALTGSSAAFAAGTLTPSNSPALAGQAATFSAGALSPAIDVALLGASAAFTAGNLTAPGDVTVALTGASATFAAGTLTPSGGDVVITVADTSGSVPGFVPGKKPRKRKGQPYMRAGQVFGEEYPLSPNMGQIQPKRATTKAKAARVSVEGLQEQDLHAIHALFMLMHDDR